MEIPHPIRLSSSDDDDADSGVVIGTKIGFIIACFVESMISGLIPVFVKSCSESPKILGIANSFAAGVFMAISLCHITPEMIETWGEICGNEDREKIFPLPEVLIFVGYALILIIDKVLFDTHALFDDHDGDHADPADAKFETSVKSSFAKAGRTSDMTTDPSELRASQV